MAVPYLQQPMSPPTGTSDAFQSIRSSCERCRFQKLKCVPIGSDGRGSCQRCARAKVECVFGRRRRASRINESKRKAEVTQFNEASLASPVTPTASSRPPSLTLTASDLEPSVGSVMYDAQGWDNIQLQDVIEKAADFANNINNCEYQHENELDDIFLFDTDQSNSTQCSPARQSQTQPLEGVIGGNDYGGVVQQLLTLLSEMQQRVKMLKEVPWQFGSVRGLDDYPIGTVLHLSQRFSVIIGPFLRSTSESVNQSTSSSSSVSDGVAVDALTTLLVVSGHISLMRMYSIVLGHFQAHLSQMPNHYPTLASDTMSPTLQLGELPCANTAQGLSRIHTALCMLQDSLSGVEGQMRRAGVLTRDIIITLLSQKPMLLGENIQDGSGGLSKQTTAVRGLLREKMSL
ncbi:hypothetical protein F5Y13DRAFT_159918 [Hypoxylon sp. FL1857]|nr:hypothetical protein F5Y13DRAFT_159918 [Hypoxylon sp. FL1857]